MLFKGERLICYNQTETKAVFFNTFTSVSDRWMRITQNLAIRIQVTQLRSKSVTLLLQGSNKTLYNSFLRLVTWNIDSEQCFGYTALLTIAPQWNSNTVKLPSMVPGYKLYIILNLTVITYNLKPIATQNLAQSSTKSSQEQNDPET